MANFVLVHGAWHGGWCWKKLTPFLLAAGHDVYTPTLTGLGERAHLLTPEIDLMMHIEDILGVLTFEDLYDVILVGHSYGGMVITGVAEQASQRLAQLVYLDALVPEDGKSLQDYVAGSTNADRVAAEGDGWRLPPPWPMEDKAFGVTDRDDLAWIKSHLRNQPFKTFTQPVRFSLEAVQPLARSYILTSMSPLFFEAAERAKAWGFHYHELRSAGHDAMVTRPQALAKLLIELA